LIPSIQNSTNEVFEEWRKMGKDKEIDSFENSSLSLEVFFLLSSLEQMPKIIESMENPSRFLNGYFNCKRSIRTDSYSFG